MALIARPGTELVEYNTDEFLVKFATYTKYLKNIDKFIYNQYEGKNAFGEILVDETKKFRPLEDLDTALLEKWLKLAWNTEFLLYISNMNHDTDILKD